MCIRLKDLVKTSIFAFLLFSAGSTIAQDGTITALNTPNEANAIPLGTGGVDDQPASETWFLQWGDPMARNITTATLTPFLPKAGKANGATVIVAPGGGFRWLSMGNEGWEVAEALLLAQIPSEINVSEGFSFLIFQNPDYSSVDRFRF